MSEIIPNWISNALFEQLLRNYYKNSSIYVVRFEIKHGIEKNQNFNSLVYRVKLTFADVNVKEKAILIKVPLTHDQPDSLYGVFDKESEVYREILPLLNTQLSKLNGSKQLLPECFGICSNKAILLEDLSANGYSTSCKIRRFNIFEAKEILKKAATFHATCAVLQEKEPNIFKNFKNGFLNRSEDSLRFFYLSNFDAFAEVTCALPEFKHLSEKLQKFRSNLLEKVFEVFDPDPTYFNTLAHGDLWTNNILLQRVDETEHVSIRNVIFIDFQYSWWTSPCVDLQWFFNTSLQDDIRFNNIDELLTFYHGELIDRLKQLNYQKHIPTFEEFYKQFLSKSLIGFIASCMLQAMILNTNLDGINHEMMTIGTPHTRRIKRRIFSEPKFLELIPKLVPIYERLGIFE